MNFGLSTWNLLSLQKLHTDNFQFVVVLLLANMPHITDISNNYIISASLINFTDMPISVLIPIFSSPE